MTRSHLLRNSINTVTKPAAQHPHPPRTHTSPPSKKQQILPMHPQASAINKVGCKIHRGHLSLGGCRNNTPLPSPQHTHTHTSCPCFAHSPHQNKIHPQKLKKQTLPITHRARHKSLTDCCSSNTSVKK